jgi:hypothetical protein
MRLLVRAALLPTPLPLQAPFCPYPYIGIESELLQHPEADAVLPASAYVPICATSVKWALLLISGDTGSVGGVRLAGGSRVSGYGLSLYVGVDGCRTRDGWQSSTNVS